VKTEEDIKIDWKRKGGIPGILGELEGDIMDIIWESGDKSGKEIYDCVRRHRKIAYTTILTILERLTAKGLIYKKKGSDGLYRLMNKLLTLSCSAAVTSFVDTLMEWDKGFLDEVLSLIEEKKAERKKVNR